MDLKSTLRSSYLLRRFSIFYLVFALLPLAILFYLYLQWDSETSSLIVSRRHLGLLIALAAGASLLSFFAMRQILAKLSLFTEAIRRVVFENIDPQTVIDLAQEEGEVAELAQSFQEVIARLEKNIMELKSTRNALNRTLSKIGHAVSSIEDMDRLVKLVLETSAEATGAKRAAVFSLNDGSFEAVSSTGFESITEETLVENARPHLEWLESQRRTLILGIDETSDESVDSLLASPLVCAPLSHRKKLCGAILFSGSQFGRDFLEDEIRIIVTLSSQLASLFENAELSAERERTYFETMSALALAVEARDPYSRGHSERVGRYAQRIGKALGLSKEDLRTISDASLLHDIGKIGITDAILHKPGTLNGEEMEVIKKHPAIGEGIVMPLKTFQQLLDPIRHHHELLDGTGYPDGLKGEEVSEITRIMVVSDIFDALTTDRPYRKAISLDQSVEILQAMVKEGKLDQSVVDTFEQIMSEDELSPAPELTS